jgi:hypothetical protein
MSATGVQLNVTAVSFATNPLKRITTLGFGLGGQLLKFKGDTDIFASVIALVGADPSITAGSGDVGTFASIVPGATGAFTATLNDAKAATGGSVVLNTSNAAFETADVQASHGAWGGVTASWQLFTADGLTPPIILTRV